MEVNKAIELATKLNNEGLHKDEWYYYPALYDKQDWFVMRRPKKTKVKVAVFTDEKMSIEERVK